MNEPRDRRLMMVPGSQLEYAVRDRSNAFWSTGIVALRAGHDGPETRYFGVLFEPKPARALLPRAPRAEVIAPQAKATDAPKKGAGGRPQYAWWDDMWAAIAVRLAEGDFRPTSLVEVEDEMNQWIVDHDHTATESTVRLKATALWRELQERRKAEN